MSNGIKEVEEFDQDIFEAMLHGDFNVTSDEDEGVEGSEGDTRNNGYQEDTDQDSEFDDDEERDEDGDGDLGDDSEDSDNDEEEDSLVEDYDSDDEDGDVDDEGEEADEADELNEDDTDEGSEDDADTEDTSDGKGSDTDKVDYKAFYEAVVNAEFVVNGRKTKGFDDPQKIIQAQQMAGGFSEKMAGFKQYRPFMSPLKDRGMLEDQAKFDLAMNLVDGDKEAIKAHLKALNIDPLDLDMDKINYEGKSSVASEEALAIEDVMERARASGIEDRVRQVVGNEWDPESFREFTTNNAVREDLLTHLETGVYDEVQNKIAELKRIDYNGAFGSLNTINQYRAAVRELQASRQVAPVQPAHATQSTQAGKTATSVKSEKAKIEQARKEEEYREKAASREAKLTQQRKRASSVSRKKAAPKAKAQFDPLKVEGKELDELMNYLATGGRG